MIGKTIFVCGGPLAAAFLATSLLASSTGARAETITNEGMPPSDPLLQMEAMYQPRDQFSLYSESEFHCPPG